MALDPAIHVQLLQDPAAFLTARGLDPALFFLDHHGRHKPLIVEHATGAVRHQVEDDGTVSPFRPAAPDPAAPPAVLSVAAAGQAAAVKMGG